MAESSFLWDNNATGDASPHSEASVAALFGVLAGAGSANQGVFSGFLNALVPTQVGNNARVDTGWAIVDGHPYWNSAAVTVTPAGSPAVGTTGRRVVLRCSWSGQTVRIVEISSADGTSTLPSLTQTSGTTYEIPLCSYTITTLGVLASFADERSFCTPGLSLDRQAFTASATWTKPSSTSAASLTLIRTWGGGGGGGGGRGGAAATDRRGGGGGGAGGYTERWIRTALLAAAETVTIGAGGTAGASGVSADGGLGGTAGNTTVGSWATASGGVGGTGGTNSAWPAGSGGGAGGAGTTQGANGGTAMVEPSNASDGQTNGVTAPGGGGGGGISPANAYNPSAVLGAGGASSVMGAVAGGSRGANGAGAAGAGTTANGIGSGGGGGGPNTAGSGSAGGAAGASAGGGGGAGGTTTGGAGGVGGIGYAEITTYI